jgi:benzoate membrane transport protein
VASGVVAIGLGVWRRMPISVVWSTPGAALLVAAGPVQGGFAAAVGAFVVTGLLIVVAGLFGVLGRAIAAIPASVASGMLAGVLLTLCLAPVRALVEVPWLAAPVVGIWLVLNRFARRWAVPAALAAAVVAIALTADAGAMGGIRPAFELTLPRWSAPAMVSIALPLFLVTMASQNVPGMAVLSGFGYRPALRPILVSTGLASAVAAPMGGHAVNLAAITAALAASPDAEPDPSRRWIASVTAGVGMLVLGLGAGLATAFVLLAPPVLIEAVAGLALFGALAAALAAAVTAPSQREAAIVTFAVTASGVSILGIGAAFWGLLAGGLMLLVRPRLSAATQNPASPVLDEPRQPASPVTDEPASPGARQPASPVIAAEPVSDVVSALVVAEPTGPESAVRSS